MPSQNPVCIITGSATGIGAACATTLAAKHWCVVINYTKSVAEAQQTAAECERLGAEVLVAQGNIAEDADCRRIAESTLNRWGRIDGLVNNAGTTRFAFDHSKLDALSATDFHDIYAVNVVGTFQMTRAVVPAMKAQGRGAIVNVSSIAGINGTGSSVAYCASKGALNTMTLSLARALAPEIRLNAVCPGFVETRWLQQGFGDKVYEKAKANYQNNVPLQRTLTPQDVANAVVYLLEGADTVTGEFITLDCGSRLGTTPHRAGR